MLDLFVATTNKKKLEEIKDLLKDLPIKVHSPSDLKISLSVREDGKTFIENAIKKALVGSRKSSMLTLGEDSGLCIDALGGAPGIYSARFAGKAKDDNKNNLKVLRLLKDVPLQKRKAHYVCALALADERGLITTLGATCCGLISFAPRGKYGFGYDPIFLVPSYGKTFGELGPSIKQRISHRSRALKKLKRFLRQYLAKST